ncbi:MAG: hypothetical protein ACK5NF_06930 [Bacilli bacterium]
MLLVNVIILAVISVVNFSADEVTSSDETELTKCIKWIISGSKTAKDNLNE